MKPPYPDNCPPDNQREMDNNAPHAANDWYDFVPPAPSTTATLAFNLDEPEGERRLRECLDAPKWKYAVWEFERWIRYLVDSDTSVTADIVRDELFRIFSEHGIDIWED